TPESVSIFTNTQFVRKQLHRKVFTAVIFIFSSPDLQLKFFASQDGDTIYRERSIFQPGFRQPHPAAGVYSVRTAADRVKSAIIFLRNSP
ncbi:MAG: hypothetical protein J5806_03195, partial [Lentisphaeria bacterium]|nr:hypothetical protein [Lentisphaeria bacterium]